MKRFGEAFSIAAAIVCAAGIALKQPALASTISRVGVEDEAIALPPPAQLRALTFGYRSAAADLLWAKLLVEHGIHWHDKRPFPGMTRFIDGIIELEPDHPTVYQFVDSLLVFRPGESATEKDARDARAYLERGTRERPYDHEVWLHYGQYVAFLAPSFLHDAAEIDEWRKAGAFAIARAVEIGADPDRSLAAATLLSKAGETAAAIRQLQHSFALANDPETRQQIVLKLQRLKANVDVQETVERVEYEWRSRYPFLSRSAALLVGPHRNPAMCAGPEPSRTMACPADWSEAAGR